MHELSVCQALLSQVAEIAADRGASGVESITLEVGPLSGVEPALLLNAFAIVRTGGCAARAVLVIESAQITIGCITCGAQSQARPNLLVCPVCGGFRTRIIAGNELRLRRVELRMPEPAAAVES